MGVKSLRKGVVPQLLRAFALLAVLWLATNAVAAELQPFSTDGCSEFPDGTLEHKDLWLECCIAHDRAYWLGGSYEQRQQADEDLQACVARVGEPEIALVMLAGVRVGGSPFWNTRFRWGYGWPYWDGWWPRGYQSLSTEEQAQVEKMLDPPPANDEYNDN
jgi:hypothetical protein